MGYILVWENGKWFYDRLTNRDYNGISVREPLYKVGDTVLFRRQKVKIEWCNCTVTDQNEYIFWYEIRKGNAHSVACAEDELQPEK